MMACTVSANWTCSKAAQLIEQPKPSGLSRKSSYKSSQGPCEEWRYGWQASTKASEKEVAPGVFYFFEAGTTTLDLQVFIMVWLKIKELKIRETTNKESQNTQTEWLTNQNANSNMSLQCYHDERKHLSGLDR